MNHYKNNIPNNKSRSKTKSHKNNRPALSLPTNPRSLPLPEGAGRPGLEDPGDGPLRLATGFQKCLCSKRIT